MLKAKHEDGSEFTIDGEEINISPEHSHLLVNIKGTTSPPNEGNPEAFYFYSYIEPAGFKITQQTEEPEEIY